MFKNFKEAKETMQNLLKLIEEFENIFKENRENIEKMTAEQRLNMAKTSGKWLKSEYNLKSLINSMNEERVSEFYEELSEEPYINAYGKTGFYYEIKELFNLRTYVGEMVEEMNNEELKNAAYGVAGVLVEKLNFSDTSALKDFVKRYALSYDDCGKEVFKDAERMLRYVGEDGIKRLAYQKIRFKSDEDVNELLMAELDKFSDEEVKNIWIQL